MNHAKKTSTYILSRILSVVFVTLVLTPTLWANSVIFQANLEGTGVYDDTGPEEPPELVWKFDAESPVISTPLVYEGIVYFIDMEGQIYAINEEDGSLAWDRELGGQPSFQITVDEDILLVGLSFFDDSTPSYLLALNRISGDELWRFYTDNQIGLDSPAIYNKKLYFTLMSDYVISLDINTGKELWRLPISGGSGQPLISEDTLYLQDDSQTLYAISLDDKNENWRKSSQGLSLGEIIHPSLNDCCIFTIRNNDTSGFITKRNKHTGELEAEFKIEYPSVSSISLSGDIAFFGDEGEGHAGAHGYMNAMDTGSGELVWRFETGGFVRGAASIAGGTVYFGSHDHYMYAVDRHTGEMKWRYETGAGIASTPAIVDGRLYFGSIDGHVYVLE